MACAEVAAISPLNVPGLDKAHTVTDLAVARNTYNTMPHIGNQKNAVPDAYKRLLEAIDLVAKHGMGQNFRPHVAHRHEFLDGDTFRCEVAVEDTPFKVTQHLNFSDFNAGNMHPTCFKVVGNELVAFEFAKGPTPLDASKIPIDFIQEWVDFVNQHQLANILTLDFGWFEKGAEPTTEIDVQLGKTSVTVTVPVSACLRPSTNVPTSWVVVSAPYKRNPDARDSSPDKPTPGTHWNEATKPDGTKTHRVHVDSLSDSCKGIELVRGLVELGVIKAF